MKTGRTQARFVSVLLAILCLSVFTQVAFAENTTVEVPCSVYEFDEDEKFPISASESSDTTDTLGTLVLSCDTGNISDAGQIDGMQQYTVSSGELSFSYRFDDSILNAEETEWHLKNVNIKKVDSIKLDKEIKSGAVIVQSSSDGVTWLTASQTCDAFKDTTTLTEPVYKARDIQLENGFYYRVIVAYELEIKVGESKVLFISNKTTQTKRVAEVYEFYAAYDEAVNDVRTVEDTPRKVLASSPVNTGKDNGFSGSEAIDKDDPHFGWNLGSFVINGYTRETSYNGDPVYLKNVGDKVILWFTLEQDINCLNGKENLSISDDNKAYDQEFGIQQTDFGHGTLIISYTDYQGVTHDPIIYTDFLAANATTGADTRVQLFEEGDYTVKLDYEIKDSPRQVGTVSVLPSYTNYTIEFSFSIRNGNCMVFPFDTVTQNELADNAITPNGFRLDMAKSRYLDIDIEKAVLNENSEGVLSTDARSFRPAADNDSYTDEGIYTFTVSNKYTGMTETKTIYVGTDKYLTALSQNNLTVEDLNEKIAEGCTVADDGTIIEPEPEPEEEEELSEENQEEPTEVSEDETDAEAETTETESVAASTDEPSPTEPEPEEDTETKTVKTGGLLIGGAIGAAAVCAVIAGIAASRRRKRKNK